jgi:exo-beta-1,3-glucanase (GH17 family)
MQVSLPDSSSSDCLRDRQRAPTEVTRYRHSALFLALTAVACVALAAAPNISRGATTNSPTESGTACARTPPAAEGLARLRAAMTHGRFIGYVPTSLQIVGGKPTRADPNIIRADLTILRPRFDSLITYSAVNGAEAIPTIAASLRFRAVIIGVYDPFNATELNAALAAAKSQPTLIVGLSLGNELLFFHRHTAAELRNLLDTVHTQAPRLPLATSEPFHVYYEASTRPILERMDFLLANVHPIFEPWFHSASDNDATQFVVNVVTKLASGYCGPILVKETGIPTAPADKGYTEQRQASFYETLHQSFPPTSERAFAFFAAFDAPWRLNDVGPAPGQRPQLEEAHWGLYGERRQPKRVVSRIPLLAPIDRQ